MKERVEVMYEGDDLESILEQVKEIELGEMTFKVIFVKINDLEGENKIEYAERRIIERRIGIVLMRKQMCAIQSVLLVLFH